MAITPRSAVAADVLNQRRGLQVGRIDATAMRTLTVLAFLGMADVIQRQSVRDLTNKQLVGVPVRGNSSIAGIEEPVSTGAASGPNPARVGLGDKPPEAFPRRESAPGLDEGGISVVPPALQMLTAPTARKHRTLAVVDSADKSSRRRSFSLTARPEKAPVVHGAPTSASNGTAAVDLDAGHAPILPFHQLGTRSLPARPFLEE